MFPNRLGPDEGMEGSRYRAGVILADGSPAEVRTVRLEDQGQVRSLHEGASDSSIYLRFFSLNRAHAIRYAEQVCAANEGSRSLVAVRNGAILGLATAVQTEPVRAAAASRPRHPVRLRCRDALRHRGGRAGPAGRLPGRGEVGRARDRPQERAAPGAPRAGHRVRGA